MRLRRWLTAPHVVQWWGDADEQFALVSGDLANPDMDQFIVATDDRPFGYLQSYNLAAWPDDAFRGQPARDARDRPVHRRAGHGRIAATAPPSFALSSMACWRPERRA